MDDPRTPHRSAAAATGRAAADSTGRDRPMQQRAARTRARLLAAAAEVFDEVGYLAATLDEIVSRAGVAKGALYFHFGSKGELAAAVVTAHHTAWAALAQDAAAGAPDALTGLDRMIDGVTQLFVASPVTRAATRLANEHHVIDTPVAEPFVGWIGRVTETLRAGKRDGSVAAHVVCAPAARSIVASYYGVQAVSFRLTRGSDLPARVTEWWAMLRPTVAAQPASA
ncbi:transcriptional regulator, TetR family [Jatrophihabitans endophyticus]|uniref:Transcriptional regulator, TetR family n=1 Tax=Jatrophihabitans endophyticus TaxID=1206085 RepID=A0A1M5DU30_9ACTN|nr:ScbR family autoregulator-binding transcription factor [Jatrophihabitans endophyticus]SHF70361.1 transcriptional regulator, TetR family [Jatrophihabitans endophyticus]